MKRIMLALAGAFLIIGNSSYAVEPYAFGIKLGGVNSGIMNLDKATNPYKTNESNFINLGIMPLLYGEYAFHENMGVALEAGYFWGVAGSFTEKNKDTNFYKINMQKIHILPIVKFYPMGREDENGILQLYVGGDLYIPLAAEKCTPKQGNNKEEDTKPIRKEDLTAFGMGAMGGVAYEFPFGLVADLRYSYTFTDVFADNAEIKKNLEFAGAATKTITTPTTTTTTTTNPNYINFSLGYNFAVLLEE